MKKIFSLFLAAALSLGAISAMAQDGKLRFGVISDIHVGSGTGTGWGVKVPRALQFMSGQGQLDALAIAGDLTDNGSEAFFQSLAATLQDENSWTNPVGELLLMMGNHDNYDGNGRTNYQKSLAFLNGGEDYPMHTYRVIRGYPFITISMMSSDYGSYPYASVSYLNEHLEKAAAECPGKPIFVFTHVPPQNSVYSTWPELENGGNWGDVSLNATLNKFPQAVVFAGHSHYPLGDPRSIHQGANPNSSRANYYTVVNTGSVTYSEIHPKAVDAGIHPEGYANVTEGLILQETEEGNIEIIRYDITRGEEIGSERWVLKAPFDGSQFAYADTRDGDDNPEGKTLRDGLPAPAFEADAEIEAEANAYDVTLTIPQAKDNECVFRYRVLVLDKVGQLIAESYTFSQFYLNNETPATITATVRGLRPEREYVAQVVALDSYDNASKPLEVEFATYSDNDPENEIPTPDAHWAFNNPNNLLEAEHGSATLEAVTFGNKSVKVCESTAEAGITAVPGPSIENGAAAMPKNAGFKLNLGLSEPTKNYTMMMDVLVRNTDGYNVLLQTNLNNTDDGDLFYKSGAIGLAALGGYKGTIKPSTWHRVVAVNRDGEFNVYVDGQFLCKATNDRWIIQPDGVLFHVDEDGEVKEMEVCELAFWNEALHDGQINHLGPIEVGEYVESPVTNIQLVDKQEFSFVVRNNTPFTFDLPEWIEMTEAETGVGENTYHFTAAAMEQSGRRIGVISIEADGVDRKEVVVTQIFTNGTIPQPCGLWTFDDPENPLAGQGVCEMFPAYNTLDGNVIAETLDEAGIVVLEEGPMPGNGAIGRAPLAYLWINTNLGNEPLTNYTLMMDIRPEKLAGCNSLYLNHTGTTSDGSLFIKHNGIGLSTQGLGYNGNMQENTWHRVVAVVENLYMFVYLDGELIGKSSVANSSLWALAPQFLLFADNNNEELWTDVAEVRFWDMPLSADYVAQLGRVEQVEQEKQPLPAPFGVWNFDDKDDILKASGEGRLTFAKKGEDKTPVTADDPWENGFVLTDGPNGKPALTVPVDRYLQIWHERSKNELQSYTMLIDVRSKRMEGYQAIYQSHTDNLKDASVFFKGSAIGLQTAGLGYAGSFKANEWYRLVFVVEGSSIAIYSNGQRLSQSTEGNSTWNLVDGALLFADNDGEEATLDISKFMLWEEPLSMGMVAELGQAVEEGEEPPVQPEVEVPNAHTTWTFDNPDNLLQAQGTASLNFAIKGSDGPVVVETAQEANIEPTDAPQNSQGAITVPIDSYLQFHPGIAEDVLNTFSFVIDFRTKLIGGYQVIYQADPTNKHDGGLFVKNNNIGFNGGGLGYHGEVQAMKWHRLVFSVKDNVTALYLDGELVSQATGSRWEWKVVDGALFFGDNDGEEGVIDIAELRFYDCALTAEQATELGVAGQATTGIVAPWANKAPQGIYDLMGRKLHTTTLQPGIYIIDGQKKVVK